MGEVITVDFTKPAKAKPIPQTAIGLTEADLRWLLAAAREYQRLGFQFPEDSLMREKLHRVFLESGNLALDVAENMGVSP